ncbi:uncharacterized protein [Paramormyrops kingsleyae]|uniref:uncharacterized protein isoform X2 n=1 Tax=Paramormyrops kingsleyae TaxID=1676925 RepID=UPI003B978FBE
MAPVHLGLVMKTHCLQTLTCRGFDQTTVSVSKESNPRGLTTRATSAPVMGKPPPAPSGSVPSDVSKAVCVDVKVFLLLYLRVMSPGFCFCDRPSRIPPGLPVPVSCLRRPPGSIPGPGGETREPASQTTHGGVGPPESHQTEVVRAQVDGPLPGYGEDVTRGSSERQTRHVVSLEPVRGCGGPRENHSRDPGGPEGRNPERQFG